MTLPCKYELTDETVTVDGRILYRIRALRDIPEACVRVGRLGGFVESEANLSHEGGCWVGDEACVYEDAFVSEDARIFGEASVYGKSRISGAARIGGRARIYERASVSGMVQVYTGAPHISGDAVISGESRIYCRARVSGNARIDGNSYIGGDVSISGNAHISSAIKRITAIEVNVPIAGEACITDDRHFFYMGPLSRENWYFLAYRTKGGGACIMRSRSGFMSDDLVEIMDESHDDWQHGDEYRALFEMARTQPKGWPDIEYGVMMQMMKARFPVEKKKFPQRRGKKMTRYRNPAGEDKPRKKKGEKKPVATTPKYELTDESITKDDHILYRIRALRNIPCHNVKSGDSGGFVESELNLSHEGDCWIGGKACVYEEACVKDDALVTGRACVYEMAEISGHTRICKDAHVHGDARIPAGCLALDANVFSNRHIFLTGPVDVVSGLGLHMVACRTRTGAISITGKRFGGRAKPMIDKKDSREEYGFLSEMARTQPENWPDIEYGFMLQMMKTRIEEWKQDS